MIKKYNQFILERNSQETNEGFKDWVAAFMLLANVGVVPLSITTANAQTKKDFVDKQPQDKIDAAKFVDYINKFGGNNPINKIWDEFILKNKDVKSQYKDVEKYINKDGKTYHFDKKFQQQDFTNVDIHKFTPSNYLTDIGGFIDDSQEPSINNFIYDYEKQTSVEVCIVTVPSLNGEDPFQYSLDQFNRIGVGKDASDNGILIMVSMLDRKWEIRTGYGVEGMLPDITCSHIGNDIIVPHFKNKDYYGGIMETLKEIKKIIDKNPDDIKKMQKEQADKESAELKEIWTNIGFGALAFAMISTLLILVYRKWKSASEMMEEVSTKMATIDKMRKSAKGVGVEEVDRLYDSFKNVINKYTLDLGKLSRSEEKPKFYQIGKHADFLMNQKKRVEGLEGFYDEIANAYNEWSDKKNRLNAIQSTISGFSVASIISAIDLGFSAWNQLKSNYGVDANYDAESLKDSASELVEIVKKLDTTYKSSISEAEKIMSSLQSKSSSISTSISGVESLLSKYKTAEDRLRNWKKLVDSAISDMNYYDRWSQGSEESTISSAVSAFSSKVGGFTKSNLLTGSSELNSLLSKISDMESKWRRRKEEEEEEERRRKRREEEEEERRRSSYSSSSSSSGSSFGGFGGGSSGGGGAGGSW